MHFLFNRCTRPQRSPRLRSPPSSSSLELLSLRLCRPSLASFPSLPSWQRPGAPFLASPQCFEISATPAPGSAFLAASLPSSFIHKKYADIGRLGWPSIFASLTILCVLVGSE